MFLVHFCIFMHLPKLKSYCSTTPHAGVWVLLRLECLAGCGCLLKAAQLFFAHYSVLVWLFCAFVYLKNLFFNNIVNELKHVELLLKFWAVKHFMLSDFERCYVNELSYFVLTLVSIDWFHVCEGGTELCMYVVVWVCAQAPLRGVMTHWNRDMTDAISKSYFNYCWGVGDCPSDNPELDFCAVQPDQHDTVTKPKSISCNCAFSKVLHYPIIEHLDVWMCVGRGEQQPCQLL